MWENRWTHRVGGVVVNSFRSLPFIILLVALIPLTRLIVGTSIGTAAAIVPLSISGIPYFGRVSEACALREVDRGLIEAVRAMGGGKWAIIREALIPEALPSLDRRLYRDARAANRSIGDGRRRRGGGLGDLAIFRYGYQRFETSVMVAVIIVLIGLVALIQIGGDWLSRSVDHR